MKQCEVIWNKYSLAKAKAANAKTELMKILLAGISYQFFFLRFCVHFVFGAMLCIVFAFVFVVIWEHISIYDWNDRVFFHFYCCFWIVRQHATLWSNAKGTIFIFIRLLLLSVFFFFCLDINFIAIVCCCCCYHKNRKVEKFFLFVGRYSALPLRFQITK